MLEDGPYELLKKKKSNRELIIVKVTANTSKFNHIKMGVRIRQRVHDFERKKNKKSQ